MAGFDRGNTSEIIWDNSWENSDNTCWLSCREP